MTFRSRDKIVINIFTMKTNNFRMILTMQATFSPFVHYSTEQTITNIKANSSDKGNFVVNSS